MLAKLLENISEVILSNALGSSPISVYGTSTFTVLFQNVIGSYLFSDIISGSLVSHLTLNRANPWKFPWEFVHTHWACKSQLPFVVSFHKHYPCPSPSASCYLYSCAEIFGLVFLLLHASDIICAIEISLDHAEECTLKLLASSVWPALYIPEIGMHCLLPHMNLDSPILFHFGKLTVPGSQSQAAFGSNLLFVHLCSKGQATLVSQVHPVLSNPSIFLSYAC